MMRRILCYGDSNTWGYTPGTGERYGPHQRWTGVAQRLLGDGYVLIEEGLNGRATVYENPLRIGRNGNEYLLPCLISQKPLDLVVLMLGTNDLAWTDALGAAAGVRAMAQNIRLASHIQESSPIFGKEPYILLISPITAHPILGEWDGMESHRRYPEESAHFGRLYEQVAREMSLPFLDAALHAQPSPLDGIHMPAESHERLGKAVAEKILLIFSDG